MDALRNKTALCLLGIFLFSIAAVCQSSGKKDWADWDFLIGEWVSGESNGVPGTASAGSFTVAPELGGKILVRKNHAEYPPANGRPAIVHDDLMIVYHEGSATKALYIDNEGHVIHYDVKFSADKKKLVMLSEKTASAPQYRLTYEGLQPGVVKLQFEIALPDKPEEFKKYVEAVVKKK